MSPDLRIEQTFRIPDAIPSYALELPPGLRQAFEQDIERIAPMLGVPFTRGITPYTAKNIAGWLIDNCRQGWLIQAAAPRCVDGRPDWDNPAREWIFAASYQSAVRQAWKWAGGRIQ